MLAFVSVTLNCVVFLSMGVPIVFETDTGITTILVQQLLVSVARYPGLRAIELLQEENKGIDVAEFELLCFCQYTQRYGRLPEFNRYTALKFSRSGGNSAG